MFKRSDRDIDASQVQAPVGSEARFGETQSDWIRTAGAADAETPDSIDDSSSVKPAGKSKAAQSLSTGTVLLIVLFAGMRVFLSQNNPRHSGGQASAASVPHQESLRPQIGRAPSVMDEMSAMALAVRKNQHELKMERKTAIGAERDQLDTIVRVTPDVHGINAGIALRRIALDAPELLVNWTQERIGTEASY
ncbi:MAG: hypothetical protein KC983_10920, partial [Phycisphaerales bacterium]|nr:hypothetical protein [Phycisphaerales bacterium]